MKLTDTMEQLLLADPAIVKAVEEGYKLADCRNGRRVARRMGTKIQMASYRYGPKSQEVADAIAEANRVSVMLTAARSAYNKILRSTAEATPEALDEATPQITVEPEPDAVVDVEKAPEAPEEATVEAEQRAKTDTAEAAFFGAADVFLTPTRADLIREATETYPSGWQRTRRTGYPYLRLLRNHANIPDITILERNQAGKLAAWSGPKKPLWTPGLPRGHGLIPEDVERNRADRDERIIAAMCTYPVDGRRTKRKGWPYLRDLRNHAGMTITRAERARLWPSNY